MSHTPTPQDTPQEAPPGWRMDSTADTPEELELAAPERVRPGSRSISPRVPREVLDALREALHQPSVDKRQQALQALAATARRERRPRAAALHLLAGDLYSQGWRLEVQGSELLLTPPPSVPTESETSSDVKQRQRAALLAARAAQLTDPSVRGFLRTLEQRRVHQGRRRSVLDLVDRGTDLAEALSHALARAPSRGAVDLASIIEPEVEVADAGARCGETGLLLQDIWRYFRHTWSLEYRPTPGRTLFLLIRNRARPGRPVMAIAALASALPQLRLREEWVGWTPAALERRLAHDPEGWPTERAALLRTVESALSEVRADDLLAEAPGLTGADLEAHLLARSSEAEEQRHEALRLRQEAGKRGEQVQPLRHMPTHPDGSVDWRAASEQPLFVRKRARLLAELLFARRLLINTEVTPTAVRQGLTRQPEVARALRIALRETRKGGLSSRLLDVNVCGAVPPYGPLLAGKLAALAVASAEVADAYATRYRGKVSEIASQLAGREVLRPAELCALTTTSLYGIASSQYNRLKLEVAQGDQRARLRWEELGLTSGFGTAHLGEALVQALRQVAIESQEARLINNLFGEGNSPRLRQIREGLEALGIPGDAILEHSSPRRVYALELSSTAREALRLNHPHLDRAPTLAAISEAWRERWLRMRVSNPSVLEEVRHQGVQSVLERLAEPDVPQLKLF